MHISAAVNSGFVGRVLKEIAIKKQGREGEMFAACVVWLEIGLRRPPRPGAGVFLLRGGRAAPSQSLLPPPPRLARWRPVNVLSRRFSERCCWFPGFFLDLLLTTSSKKTGVVCFIHYFILSI